ncbi:MAG: cell division protein ZapA [Bacteroidetes bacterium]|nr:MAG: cell division protein ZapA [Bacteroidota bacterium]MBL1144922.1 cell division protein ZapA [Bacteroidota bacterium]MCB0803204.1 cell division protein ZapA [Flavobacteriales bacterium]NOG57716.1 cell division protein ZapA [Bacteroidota bacterium]
MKDLSIKVNIANRIYPLTVKQDEEENIRLATKEINEMIKEYEQNYAVKDKQDLLAMCALQFASQKMELGQKTLIEDDGLKEKLDLLNRLVEDNL